MVRHKDLFGKELKIGDLVTTSCGYDGSLYSCIIRNFTEKGYSSVAYLHNKDGKKEFLVRTKTRLKDGMTPSSSWSSRGWDSVWGMPARTIKIEPETVFNSEEMKIYNRIKRLLNNEETTGTGSICL